MGARKRPGARWSATFTVKADFAGETGDVEADVAVDDGALRFQLRGATAVSFWWRYDGQSRSNKLGLPAGEAEAVEFRRSLVAAIAGDWPADDRRRSASRWRERRR